MDAPVWITWVFSGVGVVVGSAVISVVVKRWSAGPASQRSSTQGNNAERNNAPTGNGASVVGSVGGNVITNVTGNVTVGVPVSSARSGTERGPVESPTIRPVDLTPAEIRKDLIDAPPLQRDERAKHYRGITVCWELTYVHASKRHDDEVSVMGIWPAGDTLGDQVRFKVNLSDYPALGILKKGSVFKVTGDIAAATHYEIKLENVRLDFVSPS